MRCAFFFLSGFSDFACLMRRVQLAMDMMVTFIDIHFRALFTMPKAMKAMKAMKKAKKAAVRSLCGWC